MIIRVLDKGRDMPGLLRYLYSEGRSNVHADQHMVAGSPGLIEEWGGSLDNVEAAQLGHVLQASWRHQFVEHMAMAGGAQGGGVSRDSLKVGAAPASEQEHVYHVVFSLPADQGTLTDEQWSTVANEWVRGMGLVDDGPDGCQWAAVRHGLSAEGNDHIHVAVNLVRQDGRRADLHNDFVRSAQLRRDLENRHEFLTPLRTGVREQQQSMPTYSAAEARRGRERHEAGTGPSAPDRVVLQRAVRGAAEAATTEAEWINNVLDAGLDIEPRWADNSRTVVAGYTVQLGKPAPQPVGADAAVRYGSAQLAPDLGLRHLRARWADHETDQTRTEALLLWRGETSLASPTTVEADPELQQAATHLRQWNDRLTDGRALTDPAAWKQAAARAAGVHALISSRSPGAPGDTLGAAADRLTLYGHSTPQAYATTSNADDVASAARHLGLALRAGGPKQTAGWLAVMKQLSRTAQALGEARDARGELHAARRDLQVAHTRVGHVVDQIEAGHAVRTADIDPTNNRGSLTDRVARARQAGSTADASSVSTSATAPLFPHSPNRRDDSLGR